MGNIIATNYTRLPLCDNTGLPPTKWVQWYPLAAPVLIDATATCFRVLNNTQLHVNYTAQGLLTPTLPLPGACANVYDLITCVQTALAAQLQLDFAGARVLLGLTPTILILLSPSIGEVFLLSTRRPVLSFHISVGCPAVSTLRVLEYDDPLKILTNHASLRKNKHNPFQRLHTKTVADHTRWISGVQYALVLGCAFNVVHVSWQLGLQTIVSWKATESELVFLWSTFATGVVQVFAIATCLTSSTMHSVDFWSIPRQDGDEHDDNGGPANRRALDLLAKPSPPRAIDASSWDNQYLQGLVRIFRGLASILASILRELARRLGREATICAAKAPRHYSNNPKPESYTNTTTTLILNLVASFATVILLVYGTALFSSLLFISTLDALGVLGRYVASALVCSMVLLFELAGIVAIEPGAHENSPQQSERNLNLMATADNASLLHQSGNPIHLPTDGNSISNA